MRLFIISSVSDVVLRGILSYTNRLIITTTQAAHESLARYSIPNTLIYSVFDSEDQRNSICYKQLMPGVLDGMNIGDTPLWEIISIDRLRFWMQNAEFKDIINKVSYDSLHISLDVNDIAPWIIAMQAQRYAVPVIAMQTGYVRVQPILDFLPFAPVNGVLCGWEDDAEFVQSIAPNVRVRWTEEGKRPQRKAIDSKERGGLKTRLGLAGQVSGIIFDKQYEWEFDRLAQKIVELKLPVNMAVFPVDNRSLELYKATKIRASLDWPIIDNMDMIKVCNEVVSFCFYERIYREHDIPTAIYDWYNMHSSMELCQNLPGITLHTSFLPEGDTTPTS